jgi:peptide/nickel transport system substrate-binding protein
VAVSQALTTKPAAPFNATFQNDPAYDALYAQAVGTLDKGKQADLAHQMQKIEYDNGGNIIPYFFPVIDAASQKVQGVQETKNGLSPGGFDWKHFWMSA